MRYQGGKSRIATSIMGALVATDYKQPKQIIETNRCIQSGSLSGGKWDKIYESARRYYSTNGVAPTLHTCGGGNCDRSASTSTVLKKGGKWIYP